MNAAVLRPGTGDGGRQDLPRVLHVAPGAPFGGAQRVAIDLAAAAIAAGGAAHLLFLGDAVEAAAAARRAGVDAVTRGGSMRSRLRAFRAVVADIRPDVVQLHLPPPALVFALPKSTALVIHLHGLPPSLTEGSARARLGAVLSRHIALRADHAIAVSHWVADAWRAAGLRTRLSVIANPLPLPDEDAARHATPGNGVPGDGMPTIGTATRLVRGKGVEALVPLAAALRDRGVPFRLLVAGEGPLRPGLEAEIYARGLQSHVHLVGFVADVEAFWRGLDLAVIAAPCEPFGLRLLEPVAHGVPVAALLGGSGADEVAARCRGVAPIAGGGCPAFAATVAALLDAPAERRRMVEEGRSDIAQHFDPGRIAAAVGATHQRALRRAVRRAAP
ncbi:glycosyltransferase family 4 protein [Acuticoccus mangrovi]|uniref:Glycosyltransferase family 4 protein n=1 Tax=Acuticoccus mangrovi TaxID=2796142 RepID=A0A934IP24_9HYPH|nr:glycosyltransferase family 4 protein [Acuticoccus mangrovi]MBJ3775928.1 glycosyltransferase family 4 protein [Acuticoccus mangrovi]